MTAYDADVVVVGGGPAGLAAALNARAHGLSVLVVEPRQDPIDKACGEGLMPGGLAQLAELGVDPVGMPFRGIAYADGARRVEATFGADLGRGVRRTALHAALVDRAKTAATEWVHTRATTVTQDDAGVTVNGTIRCRHLVGADGLHSTVRRAIGISHTVGAPRRFGVRRHYAVSEVPDVVEVHWAPFGEAYVTPVEPHLIGLAILTDRHERPDLSWFPWLAEQLSEATPGPARGCGPLRHVVSRRVAGRVLLVGDAAGYEDALTGEGVSLALKQAKAAIASIVSDEPSSYELQWRRITRRYRWLTRGLVLGTRPGPSRRAIVPLCAAAPVVFRAAARTLGR